jgi:hypothetical protein
MPSELQVAEASGRHYNGPHWSGPIFLRNQERI